MSATYFECHGCGQDCSQAYATHNGYPYHFGCLPRKAILKSHTKLHSTDLQSTLIKAVGDSDAIAAYFNDEATLAAPVDAPRGHTKPNGERLSAPDLAHRFVDETYGYEPQDPMARYLRERFTEYIEIDRAMIAAPLASAHGDEPQTEGGATTGDGTKIKPMWD